MSNDDDYLLKAPVTQKAGLPMIQWKVVMDVMYQAWNKLISVKLDVFTWESMKNN